VIPAMGQGLGTVGAWLALTDAWGGSASTAYVGFPNAVPGFVRKAIRLCPVLWRVGQATSQRAPGEMGRRGWAREGAADLGISAMLKESNLGWPSATSKAGAWKTFLLLPCSLLVTCSGRSQPP
jgi:hypothetical protein